MELFNGWYWNSRALIWSIYSQSNAGTVQFLYIKYVGRTNYPSSKEKNLQIQDNEESADSTIFREDGYLLRVMNRIEWRHK